MHFRLPGILCLVLLSCGKNDTGNECTSSVTLREKASFRIGTTHDYFGQGVDDTLVARHFNRLSTENLLKMETTFPSPNTVNFDAFNLMARNAATLNMEAVHAHTVVWHRQVPVWLEAASPEEREHQLRFYCEKFREAIQNQIFLEVEGVDVVNEALNEDGSFRISLWHEAMGRNYILMAFREMSKLDASVKLFYNDYNLALNPVKLDAALDLCDWLRSKGVRVDGIGMQMHITIDEPQEQDIAAAFEKVTERGYLLHISELDISLNPRNTVSNANNDRLQIQADRYARVFRLYNALPSKYRYGITTWGFSDAHSWIPAEYNRFDAPLLFDTRRLPKPAYCACINALQ